MGFVQIMELTTTRFDELEALHDKWRQATEGKRTVTHELVCRDRDNPNTYMIVIQFPSYEDAMRNNDLPETNEIAANIAKLADGPITFRNLDLVREDSM
jgi:hypothetical protein